MYILRKRFHIATYNVIRAFYFGNKLNWPDYKLNKGRILLTA